MSIKQMLVAVSLISIISFNVIFAMPSQDPIALWRTYDLKGQARSVLKFYEENGEIKADVVRILLKNGDYCDHCKGRLKNKPYLGMTIIRGLKHKNNKWINGEVLDTDTGNTYSCNITLSDDGNTMHFHAYKGVPLFGRTVEWRRVANDS